MIEIKINTSGYLNSIHIKGHACEGQGEVCAAVSGITCAFIEVLSRGQRLIKSRIKKGDTEFLYDSRKTDDITFFYVTAMEMIGDKYPESLRLFFGR